ncbi:O-antigen ligase domain-containing protein [bacterium CPR1]|nr:O-antigen ligase domain-containing protein [bacterium CPR1]
MLGALVLVVLFPAIPAIDLWFWNPAAPGAQAVRLNPLGILLDILHNTDSGGQQASGTGLLRGVVLVAGGLWLMRLRRLPPRLGPLLLCGFLFLGVALLSSLRSSHVHDALVSWLDYLVVWLAFLMAADLTSELQHAGWSVSTVLARLLLVTAAFVMPAAIVRFMVDVGKDYGAMSGSFYQPNMFSSYLEFALGAGLALYLARPTASPEPRSLFGANLWPWLAGVVLVSVLVGLYRSYSQGAWIVSWATMLLVLALLAPQRPWLRYLLTCAAILTLAALAVLGFRAWSPLLGLAALAQLALLVWLLRPLPRPTAVFLFVLALAAFLMARQVVPLVAKVDPTERALTVARGTDVNVHARFVFYRGALRIFAQHPLLGVGPQGFQRYYPQYQEDVIYFSKFTHCIWLTILCETGLAGFLPVLVGTGWVFWMVLRRPGGSPARAGLLAGATGFLVHSTFDVQWEFLALPLTLAVVAGVLVGEVVEEAPLGD